MAPLPYSLPEAGDGGAADALDWGPGATNVPAALDGLPFGNFSKVNDKIGRIADFSTSSYGHKYQGALLTRAARASPRSAPRDALPARTARASDRIRRPRGRRRHFSLFQPSVEETRARSLSHPAAARTRSRAP